MKARVISRFTCLFMTILLIHACGGKEEHELKSIPKVHISLMDAPADYDEVNIDIRQVDVHFTATEVDAEKEWKNVSDFEPGIIDLLSLSNGNELELVNRNINVDYLHEIRLILGPDNYLMIDGKAVELTVPSGSSSGLKVKLKQPLEPGEKYDFLLDFDAARSIKAAGKSGKYQLKPVIRAKLQAETGSITGQALPARKGVTAYAILGDDSVSTFTNKEGVFLLRGLDQGIYKVSVVNRDRTIRKLTVQVWKGLITDAGIFDFQ